MAGPRAVLKINADGPNETQSSPVRDLGEESLQRGIDPVRVRTLAQQFLDNSDMVAAVGPAGSDQVDAAGAVYEAGDPNFTFISPSSTRTARGAALGSPTRYDVARRWPDPIGRSESVRSR